MTIQQVFDLALSLLPTNMDEDDSLVQYAVGWVNLAMQEMLFCENTIRVYKGIEKLDSAPILSDLNDEIDYDDSLVRYALPYFLASYMSKDDGSDYWAQDYRSRYVVAVNEALKAEPMLIEDVYCDQEREGD